MISLKIIKNFIPSLVWVLLICYLLFLYSPSSGGNKIPYFDKIAHMLLFAGLGFMLAFGCFNSFQFNKRRIWLTIFIFSLALAGLTEIVQYFYIPHRSGEIPDLLADLLGAYVGYQAYLFFVKLSPLYIRKYLIKIEHEH